MDDIFLSCRHSIGGESYEEHYRLTEIAIEFVLFFVLASVHIVSQVIIYAVNNLRRPVLTTSLMNASSILSLWLSRDGTCLFLKSFCSWLVLKLSFHIFTLSPLFPSFFVFLSSSLSGCESLSSFERRSSAQQKLFVNSNQCMIFFW